MSNSINFEQFYNIIANERRNADEVYQGIDPTTGDKLWPVPVASKNDLEEAVIAAKNAFAEWSTKPHTERIELLHSVVDELESHVSDLTMVLHKETGKPMEFAKGEITAGIATFRRHLAWNVPDEVQKEDEEVKVVIEHSPVGVVGGIVPWNFPFQLSILKIAPALVIGCTILLKPSPFTPYTALKIGEIASHVLPPGVLQIIGGDDHGGNDAAIVTADFDVAEAASMVARSTFAHSGQICIATKRIYVQDSIFNEFMQHFEAVVAQYQPGEGFCSPIQNEMQYDKVKALYQDCESNGYRFALGPCADSWNDSQPGFFIKPAIIVNPPDSARVVQEEPFGPIVPVLSWHDDSEVIARANNTNSGLGGTVFCRDKQRAWRIAGSLATGNVWVNSGLKMDPVALFGAHKQSGIGCALGPLGLKAFTNTRTITYWKDTPADKQKVGGLFG
ncbi:hypothetical protein PWT90_06371 [Aphanocladium album]|nr:hypothetical protein PWT90_06371 [Aphanocladium album]